MAQSSPSSRKLSSLFPSDAPYACFVITDQPSAPSTLALQGGYMANYKAFQKEAQDHYAVEESGVYRHALRLKGATKYVGNKGSGSQPPDREHSRSVLLTGWIKLYQPVSHTVTVVQHKPPGWNEVPLIQLNGKNNTVGVTKNGSSFSYKLAQLHTNTWYFTATFVDRAHKYQAFYINGDKVWHQNTAQGNTPRSDIFQFAVTSADDDVAVDVLSAITFRENSIKERSGSETSSAPLSRSCSLRSFM